MKKVILITLTIFFIHFCFAQSENIDSLLNLLHHHQQDDTAKVSLMNQLSLAYTYADFIKGSQMADEAISLANKLDYKQGLADAFCSKGLNQRLSGEIKESLNAFQNAYEIYESSKNRIGICKSLNLIGYAYYQMSDHDTSMQIQLHALKLAESLNDNILLGDIYIDLGSLYVSSDQIPESLDYYDKALLAYENAKYKKGIARVNGNIGGVYVATNEPEKAISYLKKAYFMFKEIGDKMGMSINIHNMGVGYENPATGDSSYPDYAKALECFNESLKIDQTTGSKRMIEINVDHMGRVYNALGDYDKAIPYLREAYIFTKSQNITAEQSRELTLLSNSILLASPDVLIKNGIDPKKRYHTALSYEYHAIKLATPTKDLVEQFVAWQNLGLIYEKGKRFDSSVIAYKIYYEKKDSFFNIEKRNELTGKSLQYDFDKREDSLKSEQGKKQALAKAEITRQKVVRNGITVIGVTLLLASIISFIFYKRRRDSKQRQNEAEFNAKVSETEMKALRSQMNPHFIFNSLNSISDYIKKNHINAADDYLVKFSQLMRLILENSEKKEVSLSSDLKALELYMQLESERLNNKFTYQITIDKDIDAGNTLIPPLLLQPFVENSIWHGIADKQGNGKISIFIKKEGNMINCIVEDDGIGLQNTTGEKTGKKSLGMKITRARIDILNKTKNANASLQLFSLQQGTRAEVKLPLQLSF